MGEINSAVVAAQCVAFIESQRNVKGRYVQAVLCNYPADSEGIINSVNGAVIDGVTVTPTEFTAWVAGATAGAAANKSNTARIVDGATEIIGELDDDGIVDALKNGKFLLSQLRDGRVKVEQDINSFISFTGEKNYIFGKNRVVRVLDEIGSNVRDIWERSYMGKVNNDANGREMFRGDIISYLTEMQRIGALREFSGADDVTVSLGDRLDAVLAKLKVKPADAMEYLYMTVDVQA
ncbi:MAG: phage tail sheath subtilisin-like domain-containing protein [Clostridiales bacterium]|jgi:hypothetical protein|nr:phage tail sheath subtilisin-like domain-containing protein [Clostridiales bacterium]